MPRNILFLVEPGREWIGGVYYVRNVMKTLSHASWISQCRVHVLVRQEFRNLFDTLEPDLPGLAVHVRRDGKPAVERFASMGLKKFGRIFDSEVLNLCRSHCIEVLFPLSSYPFWGVEGQQVHWIPDFQHLHLPQYFPVDELARRRRVHRFIESKNRPLILSSRSAMADWKRFAPRHTGKACVLPFVSDIESEIQALTESVQRSSLGELGLLQDGNIRDYFYVPNQFWQHKNHAIILDAFDKMRALGKPLPLVVCTGSTSDPRSKVHSMELLGRIENSGYASNFLVFSMVGRLQQLSIMKNARAVLQPSLFEGWNTGVQEATRLGRPLIMSNLDVHREQCPTGSKFFNPSSPDELSQLLSSYPRIEEIAESSLRQRDSELAGKYSESAMELLCP